LGVQEVGEQQAGRPRADDAHLRAHSPDHMVCRLA
jgi:hypothetical protein